MTRPLMIKDILAADAVTPGLKAASKKEVLQAMAQQAAALAGLDPITVFDVLWERERLGTTGVGYGIAIPHGRVHGLTKVRGFFARLEAPVAFESIDDKPVDLVFLLLAPETAGADHLHALATISRLLRDPKLCEQLRHAKDATAIYRILTEFSAAKAA